MTPSNDLFSLIKSLSKSEKRNFKLYASKHVIGEKNSYMDLFDCIEQQKEYDEALIKKTNKDKFFIKRFAAHKGYLYVLILKSLRVFHSNRTVELELKELLGHGLTGSALADLAVGLVTSAIVSYLSISWLLKYLQHHSTWIFIGYRLVFGILLIVFAIKDTIR